MMKMYCPSLTTYQRWKTRCVMVGDVGVGGKTYSCTVYDNHNTMDTENTISQSIRMIEAGCEIVRITAPSIKEAENLRNIKKALDKEGIKLQLLLISILPQMPQKLLQILLKKQELTR